MFPQEKTTRFHPPSGPLEMSNNAVAFLSPEDFLLLQAVACSSKNASISCGNCMAARTGSEYSPFSFRKNEINKTWHLTIANTGFIPTYHLQTKVTATERVGKETFPRTWTSPGLRTAPGGGAEAGRGSLGAGG